MLPNGFLELTQSLLVVQGPQVFVVDEPKYQLKEFYVYIIDSFH